MKNKQHEYILKAYISAKIPRMVYEDLSDMMLTFELIGILSSDILKGKKIAELNEELLTKEEKNRISLCLSNSYIDLNKRNEMIFFYRLTLLVINIIENYIT